MVEVRGRVENEEEEDGREREKKHLQEEEEEATKACTQAERKEGNKPVEENMKMQ